jgi:uncharacterized protein (TIGR02421 family)
MTDVKHHDIEAAFDGVSAIVCDRVSRNERVRRNLPGGGRVRIDRQLPFLCVYRAPRSGLDAGTRELVTTEAAYIFASGEEGQEPGLIRLMQGILGTLLEHFGKFLLLEIWADDRPQQQSSRDAMRPGFHVYSTSEPAVAPAVAALEAGLKEIRSHRWPADVEVLDGQPPSPAGLTSLASLCAEEAHCHTIGVAVRPVYRDARTGVVFPLVLQSLRRQLAVALRKCVFAFTGQGQVQPHAHYESLGPSSLVKAARLVDQQLSDVSQAFDFVLQTVPLNSAAAWEEFAAGGCARTPVFYYRPLPYDPALLKRRLFEIPLDRLEDATLIHLFQQKQDHLDRQLTALKYIDAPPFYYDSVQLYGTPDESLVQLARGVLARVADVVQHRDGAPSEVVRTEEIVAAARDQIDDYRQRLPGFVASVHVRNDLASTMLVAQDRLYVSASAAMAKHALGPLLHHEVSTHLLTYVNGRQQPFQQLYAGLAGYEELQEGLAVLAEYLAGGLTPSRLRTLACRVIAVKAMVEGRTFVEAFQLLHDEHRMPGRVAFMTALRAFRGGGLTKDIIYLRGLRDLVAHLRQGHDLEPLYVGKIALGHVPVVQELRRRGIVGPPAVLPSILEDADAALRLERCRQYSLLELVEHSS